MNDAAHVLPLAGNDALVVHAFDHGVEGVGIIDLDGLPLAHDVDEAVLDAVAVVIPAANVSRVVDRAAGTTGVADLALDDARPFVPFADGDAARIFIVADKNARLSDGDEIAIFPPVSGGSR